MSIDLAPDIRAALLQSATITALVSEWQSEPAIFTRRPIPEDAIKPFIIVSTDISILNEDGLNSKRPVILRDIIAYGDQPENYRDVEIIGYEIRNIFHRNKFSILPTDPEVEVIDIVAEGPAIAPTDDEKSIARRVTIRVRIRDKTS